MDARNSRYDLVRGLAIILIVFIHSTGVITDAAESGPAWLRLEVAGIRSIIDMGVHLFILLSGALLLGKEEPAGVFYAKRAKRILPAFLVWSVVVFVLTGLTTTGYSWSSALPDFFRQLFGGGVHHTYWFVYMILGLYLVTPLLRVICKQYAGLLLGICVAVFLLHLVWPEFSVTGRWYSRNASCLLDFVAGFFIVHHLREKAWLRSAGLTLALVSILADICCRFFLNQVWPFEVTSAMGVFAWIVSLPREPRLSGTFRLLGDTSFGIYLSHCILISAFLRLPFTAAIPAWASPFLTAGAVLPAELLLMWTLRKLRLDKWLA